MKYLASDLSRVAREYVAFPLLALIAAHTIVHAQSASDVTEPGGAEAGNSGTTNGRRFVIVPRISISETWTDNVRLSNADKRADMITTVSPGVSIRSDAGKLRGYLDYSLSRVQYAREGGSSSTQNLLNSMMTYEAVSNFAYIDVNGAISQQAISPFGQQSIDNSSINANRTEVATFSVSPYVRGRLAELANYQVRYTRSATRSKSENASDGDTSDLTASLSGESNSRVLSWSTTASHSESKFNPGRSTEADRLRAVVTAVVNPQFNVSLIGGHESNNYASQDKQGKTNYGLGFGWALGERTRLKGEIEERFFGKSHSLTFEHRTARTAWRLSDTKDVVVTPNQMGTSGRGSLYDLYFNQFAAIQPDPVLRAVLVENFLRTNGLNGQQNNVGFLTSGVTLQRRQDVAFTYLGLRDTLTLIATRGTTSAILGGIGGSDDFSTSSAIRQAGWTVSLSHRLTQETSLIGVYNQLRSSGDLVGQSSNLRSLNMTVSTRLGLRTTASVGARHTIVDSTSSPYKESAAFGSLNFQF
jgi:uncharacterized protein (PEP-CTERM system associated)